MVNTAETNTIAVAVQRQTVAVAQTQIAISSLEEVLRNAQILGITDEQKQGLYKSLDLLKQTARQKDLSNSANLHLFIESL